MGYHLSVQQGGRVKRFRFIDHTGDLGMEIYGQSLTDLFENAGEALFHVITDPLRVREKVERAIALNYRDLETLMVDWLSQLLYLHDVEELLLMRFKVRNIDDGRFEALAWGEFFQEEHHIIRTGVKAVTFHQLEVKQQRDRWQARVILDL
jgi:SHS2 domain-containing protein